MVSFTIFKFFECTWRTSSMSWMSVAVSAATAVTFVDNQFQLKFITLYKFIFLFPCSSFSVFVPPYIQESEVSVRINKRTHLLGEEKGMPFLCVHTQRTSESERVTEWSFSKVENTKFSQNMRKDWYTISMQSSNSPHQIQRRRSNILRNRINHWSF